MVSHNAGSLEERKSLGTYFGWPRGWCSPLRPRWVTCSEASREGTSHADHSAAWWHQDPPRPGKGGMRFAPSPRNDPLALWWEKFSLTLTHLLLLYHPVVVFLQPLHKGSPLLPINLSSASRYQLQTTQLVLRTQRTAHLAHPLAVPPDKGSLPHKTTVGFSSSERVLDSKIDELILLCNRCNLGSEQILG